MIKEIYDNYKYEFFIIFEMIFLVLAFKFTLFKVLFIGWCWFEFLAVVSIFVLLNKLYAYMKIAPTETIKKYVTFKKYSTKIPKFHFKHMFYFIFVVCLFNNDWVFTAIIRSAIIIHAYANVYLAFKIQELSKKIGII